MLILFLEGLKIEILNNLAVPLDSRWLNLQNEIAEYHRQNLLLEDELLHDEALTTIYQEAVKKGFVPLQTVISF